MKIWQNDRTLEVQWIFSVFFIQHQGYISYSLFPSFGQILFESVYYNPKMSIDGNFHEIWRKKSQNSAKFSTRSPMPTFPPKFSFQNKKCELLFDFLESL